ncbi:ATP-binding protein [Curvibacter sp. CHRR-16]|uniref:ATP-binding protein n=1 Tax=Curvibacter sp. CHRR-16 TaxID=2835872 RepID=UPI0032E9CCDE
MRIPCYTQDKVFERFYSLARPHSKKKSTGLGLSFVKEIASLHRGKVELGIRQRRKARVHARSFGCREVQNSVSTRSALRR